MRALFLCLTFALAAYSQPVRFGVKGGVPLGSPTRDFGSLRIDSDHWTVGPTVEFRLPAHLAIEISGLYSSYTVHYPSIPVHDITPADTTGDTHAWNFPAALKYRFLDTAVTPFILGGVNYRRENSEIHTSAPYTASQDRLGPLAGGGVEWKAGRLRLAPEFRYTRLNRPGANQYSLLFGITF